MGGRDFGVHVLQGVLDSRATTGAYPTGQFCGQSCQLGFGSLLIIGRADEINFWHDQGVYPITGNDVLGITDRCIDVGVGVEFGFESRQVVDLTGHFSGEAGLIGAAEILGTGNFGAESIERCQPSANFVITAGDDEL